MSLIQRVRDHDGQKPKVPGEEFGGLRFQLHDPCCQVEERTKYGRGLLGYLSEGLCEFARGARTFFGGVPGTHDDGGDDSRNGDGHDRNTP